MTTLEALHVSTFEHEEDRNFRYCGLILPDQMPEFACNSLEDQDLWSFDTLSELSNAGLVYFRDRLVRIDDRLENGNLIRSVVEPFFVDEQGNVWANSYNHIAHREGGNYFEKHPCIISPSENIWEPGVGSADISAGTYQEMILHGLIANEGIALPATA